MNFANEQDSPRSSPTSTSLHQKPRLIMEHGFVRAIEHRQHSRARQAKEDSRRYDGKPNSKVPANIPASKTPKPTLEYYQVPNRRSVADFSFGGGSGIKSPVNGNGDTEPHSSGPPPGVHPLSKSSSTTHARVVHFQLPGPSQHHAAATPSAPAPFGLKRSKSLGAGDLLKVRRANSDFDLNGYELEVQTLLRRAIDDPNSLSTRHLMDAVRHLFTRLIEGTRYAEPTARICIAIIEKEKNATFLESLLNTCREWYWERNRLASGASGASRWLAYVTFLYELYGCAKTRGVGAPRAASSTSNPPEVPAQTTLLTLLSECCIVLSRPPSVNRLTDVECLFFVLTSVGRDLQSELPQRMEAVLEVMRDSFLDTTVPPQVRKTLMQLIELHASKWQLSASAVMYYYPGSHDRS